MNLKRTVLKLIRRLLHSTPRAAKQGERVLLRRSYTFYEVDRIDRWINSHACPAGTIVEVVDTLHDQIKVRTNDDATREFWIMEKRWVRSGMQPLS